MPLVPHVSPNTTITSAWGNLVADHVVSRFATAAQRTTQLPAPALNQLTQRDDRPGVIERWTGTAWVETLAPRELGYTEFTAQKSVTGTSEASGTSIVTSPGFTLDGLTPVLVEIFSPAVLVPAIVNGNVISYIYQNGTGGGTALSLGQAALLQTATASAGYVPLYAARRVTPPAGSYTFIWGAYATGGTGTIYGGAGTVGALAPGFIRVTRAA